MSRLQIAGAIAFFATLIFMMCLCIVTPPHGRADPRHEASRPWPVDADPIRFVETADAGEDARGVLNAPGIHCRVAFGSDVGIVYFESGRREIWSLNDGDSVLTFDGNEADDACHMEYESLDGDGHVNAGVSVKDGAGVTGWFEIRGDASETSARRK